MPTFDDLDSGSIGAELKKYHRVDHEEHSEGEGNDLAHDATVGGNTGGDESPSLVHAQAHAQAQAQAQALALAVAEEAIRKSEVLQMQGNASAAVAEVLGAMGRLRAMDRTGAGAGTRVGSEEEGETEAGVCAEGSRGFALCQRRLGVLYKVLGQYGDAEESIRQFIVHLEDAARASEGGQGTAEDEQDLAVAHTLLSSILDRTGGRSVEARQSDRKAAKLMAGSGSRASSEKSPRQLI